jgi:hypothetical protein
MPHTRWLFGSEAVGRLCATASARSRSEGGVTLDARSSSQAGVAWAPAETTALTLECKRRKRDTHRGAGSAPQRRPRAGCDR